MQVLRAMMAVQEQQGAVDDAALTALAEQFGLPLHRLQGLRSFYPVFRESPGRRHCLHVCRDVVCRLRAGPDGIRQVQAALAGRGDVEVHPVSCLGQCDRAPAALFDDRPVTADPGRIADLVSSPPVPVSAARPVLPTDPYAGGDAADYAVSRRVLTCASPQSVIDALDRSGLRGLGGAAFPTGRKWAFTRAAGGDRKTVICNADESEPGTFKDRELLEHGAHLVIEGMILGAWVVGAHHGIVYIRHEYAEGARALAQAIDRARAAGALGESVHGTGHALDIEVFVSPGGYILGEETALLEALEDRRGEPRNKPPFPVQAGLNGQPTLINNVETFAAVPVICERGADWWRGQGVGDHAGLKYVSVSGDVVQPGVHCLPWGTPARVALERCGGIRDGLGVKAFSPGGASTPFLPPDQLDVALDFDALREAGSSLGTGAMLFVAEDRNLLDVTLAQVRFFRNESCGKCVPCRVGTDQAVRLVESFRKGDFAGDRRLPLKPLQRTLARTSICGLGQVALSPLVDALDRFPRDPDLAPLAGVCEP